MEINCNNCNLTGKCNIYKECLHNNYSWFEPKRIELSKEVYEMLRSDSTKLAQISGFIDAMNIIVTGETNCGLKSDYEFRYIQIMKRITDILGV
jgi:hypothetical protein